MNRPTHLLGTIMLSTICCVVGCTRDIDTDGVNHEGLAESLCQELGLIHYLPANPLPHDMFEILAFNGITPHGGWRSSKIMTKADLCMVLVKSAIRMGYDISINTESPEECCEYADENFLRHGDEIEFAPLMNPFVPTQLY